MSRVKGFFEGTFMGLILAIVGVMTMFIFDVLMNLMTYIINNFNYSAEMVIIGTISIIFIVAGGITGAILKE